MRGLQDLAVALPDSPHHQLGGERSPFLRRFHFALLFILDAINQIQSANQIISKFLLRCQFCQHGFIRTLNVNGNPVCQFERRRDLRILYTGQQLQVDITAESVLLSLIC